MSKFILKLTFSEVDMFVYQPEPGKVGFTAVSRWASEYDASKVDVMDTKKFLEELFGEKLTLHFTSCRKFDNTFFKKVSELLEMIQNPHFPSDPVTNRALNLIKKAIEDHQEWERNGCHGCGKYGTHDHGPCWL